MKQFKYHFDNSSKKFNCPQCGKKTFVKYVDIETGHYADDRYGKCDRKNKCDYMLYPNDYTIVNYNYIAPKPIEPSFIEKDIFQATLHKYDMNPLATYLINNYNEDEVISVIQKYKLGTSNMFNSSAVFWQIDTSGNIRSGKIMAYDVVSGKREKKEDGSPLISWAHTALRLPEFNLSQCLFGLHLLSESEKQVAIVESEKTAIIMSIELPNYTWMATGSLGGFKYDYLKPLKGKEIIAFPDKGGYDNWKNTAKDLNRKGFNIIVSQLLEVDEFEMGWDIVDVLIYEKNNNID